MIWPSISFDISLQNFKKPLDIFSPQIERKRSKEYLVIILAKSIYYFLRPNYSQVQNNWRQNDLTVES